MITGFHGHNDGCAWKPQRLKSMKSMYTCVGRPHSATSSCYEALPHADLSQVPKAAAASTCISVLTLYVFNPVYVNVPVASLCASLLHEHDMHTRPGCETRQAYLVAVPGLLQGPLQLLLLQLQCGYAAGELLNLAL